MFSIVPSRLIFFLKQRINRLPRMNAQKMSQVYRTEEIEYKTLNEDNAEEVIKNFEENYGKDEPIKNLLGGMGQTPFIPIYIRLLCPQGATVVLYGKESKMIAGYMLNQIIANNVNILNEAFSEAEEQVANKTDKFNIKVLSSVLGELSNHFLDLNKNKKILHMSHLSVSRTHRQRGISRLLISASESKARQAGCDILMTEGTSAFSQVAFQKMGLVPIKQIFYHDCYVDGVKVFEEPSELHSSGMTLIKTLK